MKKIVLIFQFFLLFLTVGAQKNDTLLANLITNLRNYYVLNPVEKCYLQTDKSFYQPGEAVWFTSKLTLYERTSSLSKVIYTDLSDASGNIYHKGMWKTENGFISGNYYLPDTLKTGIYRIRSYSLWMLNQPNTIGEQYFFVLGKKDQSKSFVSTISKSSVSFFPEGGKIVSGISNRIVFKITGDDGIPVSKVYALKLTDASNNNIVTSPFFQNGIGILEFIPEKNKVYNLSVQYHLNASEIFHLPAAIEDGMVLKVNNLSPSKLFISANGSESFINKHKKIIILAQQDGKVVLLSEFNLEEQQNATVLNKKILSNGVIQVTAFDEQLNPLSERWIMNYHSNTSTLNLKPLTINFQPKELNSLELTLTGIDTPHITVSVIPADLPMPGFIHQINAENYLHIQSNKIENNYNLNWNTIADSLHTIYLDALTLTIRPGNFNWAQIKIGKQPKLNYFFETGISIRGLIVKDKESMAFDSSRINIITKGEDSTTIMSTAKTDNKGAFAVNDLDFWKKATVYLQGITKEKKKRKVSFSLQPSYIDTLSKISTPFLLHPNLIEEKIATHQQNEFIKNYSVSKLGKELGEIVIQGKKISKEDSVSQAYTSELFRNSDFTVMPDEKFGYASIWQMLQELIPGLYVSSATINIPMVSFNRYTLSNDRVANGDGSANSVTEVPIAFFLNEIPIDISEVSMINPRDVSLIKANRTPNVVIGSFAISAGAEGSIMIYTKKNTGSKFGFDASSLSGYSIPSSFLMPDYSKPELLKTEDRRTTLLWQPYVKFENGKAIIQFYNNDYAKRFKVVVQGIDKNGNLYYLEKIIE